MDMQDAPSPNFDERKHDVDMLVLHYTGMENGALALDRLRDPEAKVSSHYLVFENGDIVRMVPESLRAWHAGAGSWQGDDDLNSRSVGIEIVNGGHDFLADDGALPAYPEAQVQAVLALCKFILKRHNIPMSRIVGHSDIAPARKTDPGEHFPWERFAKAGVGVWPAQPDPDGLMGKGVEAGDDGAAVERLQKAFAEIGYGIKLTGKLDAQTMTVVRAFQRRFVQDRVTGLVDLKTAALVEAVRSLYASSAASA